MAAKRMSGPRGAGQPQPSVWGNPWFGRIVWCGAAPTFGLGEPLVWADRVVRGSPNLRFGGTLGLGGSCGAGQPQPSVWGNPWFGRIVRCGAAPTFGLGEPLVWADRVVRGSPNLRFGGTLGLGGSCWAGQPQPSVWGNPWLGGSCGAGQPQPSVWGNPWLGGSCGAGQPQPSVWGNPWFGRIVWCGAAPTFGLGEPLV